MIVGVPGAVANDLVDAAGGKADPIEVETPPPVDKHQLKSSIVSMVKKGPAPLRYWTYQIIDQWCQSERQHIPGTAKECRDAIAELINEKVLVRQPRDDPQKGNVTEVVLDESVAQKQGYIS